MAASREQAGPTPSSKPAATTVNRNPHRHRATAEVDAYRKAPGVVIKEQKGEVTIYGNPLEWWKDNSANIPVLSVLARRLLAIPATLAQSELAFSSAGQIPKQTGSEQSQPSCVTFALVRIG